MLKIMDFIKAAFYEGFTGLKFTYKELKQSTHFTCRVLRICLKTTYKAFNQGCPV